MSWMLIVLLIAGLSACGKSSDPTPAPPQAEAPAETPEETPEETPGETPEEAQEEAPVDAVPAQDVSYWGDWKMVKWGHLYDMGFGTDNVPEDKVFGDNTKPMWMTLNPDGTGEWGYNIFKFTVTWNVEDGKLIVYCTEPIEQTFTGVIQEDGSIHDPKLWDSHNITMARTPAAPAWSVYEAAQNEAKAKEYETQVVASLVGKPFAAVEASGMFLENAAETIWMRLEADKKLTNPRVNQQIGTWGTDAQGAFVELEEEKHYLYFLDDGRFKLTDLDMVFASEGTIFDILAAQPYTEAQNFYSGYWTGSLSYENFPEHQEKAGAYKELLSGTAEVIGHMDIGADGKGTFVVDLADPHLFPQLAAHQPIFTANVAVAEDLSFSASEATFLGKPYTGTLEALFNQFLLIRLPEYADDQGALSARFMMDPVSKSGPNLTTKPAYTVSRGPMGFADPQYNTANGSIWDGLYKGTAWVTEAGGASAEINDIWFDVNGEIAIWENGLRFVEVTDTKEGSGPLLSYFVKADNRHFEIYMDVPDESNFFYYVTDKMTGDEEKYHYITDKEELSDFSAFFVPGGTDRFVLRHRVEDPKDPSNYYVIYCDLRRVTQ